MELIPAPAEEQTPLSSLARKTQTGRVEVGEGGGDSIRFLHQTEKKNPRCPIKRTAQWYILPAAAAIRGAGNSTILWASAASRFTPQLTTEAAAIVQRERALICKHGGVILIPGRQDAISGACRRWLRSSPALDVAVPALHLVRLGHVGRAADVVGQVGPEALRFPQLPYDLHHLQPQPKETEI